MVDQGYCGGMTQGPAEISIDGLFELSSPSPRPRRSRSVRPAAGVTLVAIARADSFEVFTRPHRSRLGNVCQNSSIFST